MSIQCGVERGDEVCTAVCLRRDGDRGDLRAANERGDVGALVGEITTVHIGEIDTVRDVTVEGLWFDDKPILSAEQGGCRLEFAENVRFLPGKPAPARQR